LNDQQLLQYYLQLHHPDSYPWNLSPENLYVEFIIRDFVQTHVSFREGMTVCNIGIGVGEWDDFLGYLLHGKGTLTSVDIDTEICAIFQYRQQKEQHPNPAIVLCEDMLQMKLEEEFDLVTMIGSTLKEIGRYEEALDICFRLMKPDGLFVYMDFSKNHLPDRFEKYLRDKTSYRILKRQIEDRFSNLQFYIYLIKREK
jgi:ubiquinone/menaquinone biosynthesis C-methylase UbiE